MLVYCLVRLGTGNVFDEVVGIFSRDKDLKAYIGSEFPNAVADNNDEYKLVDGSTLKVVRTDEKH